MVDTVTSQTIVDTSGTKTVMKFTNISDGSGETLVTKMDASVLTHMTEDATKKISKIWWTCNTNSGNGGVEVIWAGSGTSGANATALFLSGEGYWDLHTAGNGIGNNATLEASTSPAGDILFSTKNFTQNDSYTIIIEVR